MLKKGHPRPGVECGIVGVEVCLLGRDCRGGTAESSPAIKEGTRTKQTRGRTDVYGGMSTQTEVDRTADHRKSEAGGRVGGAGRGSGTRPIAKGLGARCVFSRPNEGTRMHEGLTNQRSRNRGVNADEERTPTRWRRKTSNTARVLETALRLARRGCQTRNAAQETGFQPNKKVRLYSAT